MRVHIPQGDTHMKFRIVIGLGVLLAASATSIGCSKDLADTSSDGSETEEFFADFGNKNHFLWVYTPPKLTSGADNTELLQCWYRAKVAKDVDLNVEANRIAAYEKSQKVLVNGGKSKQFSYHKNGKMVKNEDVVKLFGNLSMADDLAATSGQSSGNGGGSSGMSDEERAQRRLENTQRIAGLVTTGLTGAATLTQQFQFRDYAGAASTIGSVAGPLLCRQRQAQTLREQIKQAERNIWRDFTFTAIGSVAGAFTGDTGSKLASIASAIASGTNSLAQACGSAGIQVASMGGTPLDPAVQDQGVPTDASLALNDYGSVAQGAGGINTGADQQLSKDQFRAIEKALKQVRTSGEPCPTPAEAVAQWRANTGR